MTAIESAQTDAQAAIEQLQDIISAIEVAEAESAELERRAGEAQASVTESRVDALAGGGSVEDSSDLGRLGTLQVEARVSQEVVSELESRRSECAKAVAATRVSLEVALRERVDPEAKHILRDAAHTLASAVARLNRLAEASANCSARNPPVATLQSAANALIWSTGLPENRIASEYDRLTEDDFAAIASGLEMVAELRRTEARQNN